MPSRWISISLLVLGRPFQNGCSWRGGRASKRPTPPKNRRSLLLPQVPEVAHVALFYSPVASGSLGGGNQSDVADTSFTAVCGRFTAESTFAFRVL